MTRRRALAALGLAGASALAGCAMTAERNRRTATEQFSIAGDRVETVVVRGDDGETTVRSHDGDAVVVDAEKFALGQTALSSVTVTREVVAGRLTVGVEVATGIQLGRAGGGLERLDVAVPQGVRVERVAIDDGTGQVESVSGDLTLAVDDGSATVGPVAGAVDVTADDGDVTLGDVAAVTGTVDDGRLRMTAPATIGDLRGDDGSFDLMAAGLDSDVTIVTDDGDVDLALADTVDAMVDVTVNDGRVQVDDGVLEDVTTTGTGGTVTRGRIGTGDDRLRVRVDDGSVRLRAL